MGNASADPSILSLDTTSHLGFHLFLGDRQYNVQPIQLMLSTGAWEALGSPTEIAVSVAPSGGDEIGEHVSLVEAEPMVPIPEVLPSNDLTEEEIHAINLSELEAASAPSAPPEVAPNSDAGVVPETVIGTVE